MKCPFCDPDAGDRGIRALHAHLAADHPGEVGTEELGDRTVYVVTCPHCSAQHRQPIKKSKGNAQFLVEFEQQIRLVAFDMLINHVLAEHESEPALPDERAR